MISSKTLSIWFGIALSLSGFSVLAEQSVDFGDDSSSWAYDGECDDPQFEGDGMATTVLEEDRAHDATDCRVLFNQGRVTLRGASKPAPVGSAMTSGIDFGDDTSSWAHDGECDDPRFQGSGSAATLLDDDRYHDATDCRDLFNLGRIALGDQVHTVAAVDVSIDEIDFGNNTSEWSSDGECDDPRFRGAGAAETLLDEDLMSDSKDCRSLFERGRITLDPNYSPPIILTPGSRKDGRLEHGDTTLDSGEFSDTFVFEGRAREHVTVDLRSGDFDPYLIIRTPSGEQFDNDDYETDSTWSMLSLTLPETGRYIVRVTSYEAGEAGSYTVTMRGQVANESSPDDQPALQARVML